MIIISVLIGLYTFFFTRISFLKYDNFLFDDFDLAHHAQQIWNMLHGSIESSILGLKFLGNHVHIIEFFIIPLYAVFPTPKTLLFLQSLFLGLGAWPLYLIAKRQLPKNGALVISFCYLIYPALGYVNLFEFHPQSLAIFFILFTFYFFEKENFKVFLIFMILSLACQENISLLIITFGFYALMVKKRIRWAVTPLIAGISWFFIAILIVLPYFNKGEVGFYNIYGHLGHNIWEIAANILLHPIKIIRSLVTTQNIVYLFQLLAPVSFLPFLSQGVVLFFIPPLLQHLLSQRLSEHTIYYQYTIEVIPFIFIGMVYGLKRMLEIQILRDNTKKIFLAVIIIALSANILLGPHFSLWPKIDDRIKNLRQEKGKLVNLIPPRASVVATFEFLPHLAHREKLYSFHHLYIGKHTLSDKEYFLPTDVEYALIDFTDPLTFRGFYNYDGDIRIRKFLEEGKWGAIEMRENIVLFKKNYISSVNPYSIIKEAVKPDNSIKLNNGEIEFFNYKSQLNSVNGHKYATVSLNYKCFKPTNKNYCLLIQIIDRNNQIVYNTTHPINYGIYPTYRWKEGEMIKESFTMPWLAQAKSGSYKIMVFVFDFITGQEELLNNSSNAFIAGEILSKPK